MLDLGLEDRMTTKVGLLSGGQRQALTLLMATLKKPDILLLDEHTAALDPKTAAKVLGLSDKIIAENNLTAMMVTHNMADLHRRRRTCHWVLKHAAYKSSAFVLGKSHNIFSVNIYRTVVYGPHARHSVERGGFPRAVSAIGLAAVIIGDVLGTVIFGKRFNFVARLAFTAIGGIIYFMVLR